MSVQARDTYPAGVPCWVDHESIDPAAAVEFYTGVFGWRFEDRLLGVVTVGPHSVGPTDLAELRDPLGGACTVNHFVPERVAGG